MAEKLKVLDLFSGIGGFSLGLERTGGFETVAFCEIEEYLQKVLRRHWPGVPIYEDVRELTGEKLRRDGITVDVICGGYPCQPFSHAGKRAGENDDRHLWPEMYRLIRDIRPRWVVAENVAGHISMGLDDVLSDLESENYTCWTFVIPACAVDAKHRRDRVWIVANSNGDPIWEQSGWRGREDRKDSPQPELNGETQSLANAEGKFSGCCVDKGIGEGGGEASSARKMELRNTDSCGIFTWSQDVADNIGNRGRPKSGCEWPPEPGVGRVANGVSRRVDRLRSLGNAVVPQIPEIIGRAIMAIEHDSQNARMTARYRPNKVVKLNDNR